MAEPERIYSAEQLAGDGVSKKDLVTFLQQHASIQVGIPIKARTCLIFQKLLKSRIRRSINRMCIIA